MDVLTGQESIKTDVNVKISFDAQQAAILGTIIFFSIALAIIIGGVVTKKVN